jgi:hypothetical protein
MAGPVDSAARDALLVQAFHDCREPSPRHKADDRVRRNPALTEIHLSDWRALLAHFRSRSTGRQARRATLNQESGDGRGTTGSLRASTVNNPAIGASVM